MREARYRDDMREGLELRIQLDDQGDAYVSVLPVGHKIGPSVRLCASGGAASLAPGLLPAIRRAFEAIQKGRALNDPCPWLAVVELLADGELHDAEHAGASAHLAGCAECQDVFASAVQFAVLAGAAAALRREVAVTRGMSRDVMDDYNAATGRPSPSAPLKSDTDGESNG